MGKLSRRTKIIIAFVAIVVAGYLVVFFTQKSAAVPQSFTSARSQGAIIAQNIVDLSNKSTNQLEQVDKLDQQGDYKGALAIVSTLVTQSTDIRNQAVNLSTQIESMTQALSDISNFDAQQAALEAISNRLALINQLINYSGDLGNLLNVLQNRFSGAGGTNMQVTTLVNQINTDVNAINNFNSQATQAMTKFDSIVSK